VSTARVMPQINRGISINGDNARVLWLSTITRADYSRCEFIGEMYRRAERVRERGGGEEREEETRTRKRYVNESDVSRGRSDSSATCNLTWNYDQFRAGEPFKPAP